MSRRIIPRHGTVSMRGTVQPSFSRHINYPPKPMALPPRIQPRPIPSTFIQTSAVPVRIVQHRPAPKPRATRVVAKPRARPNAKPLPFRASTRATRSKAAARTNALYVAEKKAIEKRLKENRTTNSIMAREIYQAELDKKIENYISRASIAYQLGIDPMQRKANEAMRQENLEHVDKIYSEKELKKIENKFGTLTYGNGPPQPLTQPTLNPAQVQTLRERIAKARRQTKKRTGTLKARKHAGEGTKF